MKSFRGHSRCESKIASESALSNKSLGHRVIEDKRFIDLSSQICLVCLQHAVKVALLLLWHVAYL